MALGQFYRFHVVNNSGQLVTFDSNGRVVLHYAQVNITPGTGKIAYGSGDSVSMITAGQSVADGAFDKTAEIDNTSDLFPNALVSLEVTHDEGALADGRFDIFYESGIGTGDLPSDKNGFSDPETNGLTFVGSLIWDASPSDDELLESVEHLI